GLRNLLIRSYPAQIAGDLTAGNQFADMIDATKFWALELRDGHPASGIGGEQLLDAAPHCPLWFESMEGPRDVTAVDAIVAKIGRGVGGKADAALGQQL